MRPRFAASVARTVARRIRACALDLGGWTVATECANGAYASTAAAALAAVLTLALLAPTLLRNDHGAEGPRSPITRAGNVTALRFGEQPGETTVLEAGCYDLAVGSCH